ncbi:phosphoglucomutase [Micractinium conductrix]|uniref:phosphoglucomutase (alpha-D-glucose-1,6-bisphosphate-dependent) n=1 Tax=Micractinium conductrix TaxID=554055 RepID=A0A2P6VC74_9CHLO|nr:phosphoglucomutase [Micractinium conductrix]|eukprot:PSC71684.1 phosphoglucomutase [Micractinium conductrix]
MQAMAAAQAASQSACPDNDLPFSTLASDLGEPALSPDARLRMLLEQGKDVEQAVLGCLKDTLFDLHEGVVWGLLEPNFEEAQRQALVNAAANELHTDKQLCLQLAREHGLDERYAAALKKAAPRATADYERVGELKFGLLVWRANLRRDASLADDPQELEALLQGAYTQALRLIRRCGRRSQRYWSVQQAGSAPGQGSLRKVYGAAVQRAQNALLELVQGRQGVDAAALQRMFEQAPDPEAVEEEPEAEEEGDAGAAGGSPAPRAAGAHPGQQRQQQLAQQPQQRARRALRRLAAVPPAAAAAPAAPAAVDPATLKAYLKVQNGSDVRGVAIDTNPNEPITLTPAMMFFLGRAFAEWLSENKGHPVGTLRVSTGHDPRLSSPLMDASLAAGLAAAGAQVARFGGCTTPAMFMSCILPGHEYDGAIMITASHLPVNRNGAKFCTAEGGLEKADITALVTRAAELATKAGQLAADRCNDHAFVITAALQTSNELVRSVDFLPEYAAYLRELMKKAISHPAHPDAPLAGLKIVVNPGNGGGGFIAEQVLGPLGADVSPSIHLEPDGSFPNHIPNPEDKAAVAATRTAVLASKADMGIMLDTDVDRSGVVDSAGNGINRNRYIALMSAIALREHPGETVVTDSCTSNGLAAFIAALGGKHFRYKKGYKNIINKGVELNKAGVPCPLMMETSGHGAMRENYFLDDGAYGALKVVIEAVRRRLEGAGDIAELLADLREPVEAMEIRVALKAADVRAEGERVTAAFKEWVDAGCCGASHWQLEKENYEGWRVKVDEGDSSEGWILLRPSLHDPDVVLNVESEHEGGMRAILAHLLEFFKAHPEFDVCTGKVEDYVFAPAPAK